MLRDNDFGVVRVRAFGTYDFRIVQPATFLREVAGSDHNFRLDEFNDTMRSRIVSLFTDAIASAKVPVLDVASRYSELGDALLPMINPAVTAKYGLEITSFIVENVSVPPEVESAIDKRSSMTAIGNLNDYVKYQMAQGMEKGSGGAGPAGTAAELAVGFGLAQQMMQQGFTGGAAAPRGGARAAGPGRSGARARRQRSRRDGGARIGRAQGQEDRIVVAHHARGAQRLSGGVALADETFSALEKHACPACGAQAEWNPSKQKLVCPFCGTESPYSIDRDIGKVGERELDAGLRDSAAAEREPQRPAPQRAVPELQGDHGLRRRRASARTASSAARRRSSPTKTSSRRFAPKACCRFASIAIACATTSAGWWRSKWLAPGRLAKAALVDTVKSLYIPYWTFDARAHCPWDAEAGHYYYVNVEGRDSKGRRVVRQERRVRWEHASGVVDHSFDDELVPGTTGVDMNLLRQVEPFPTQEIVPYDTAFLSGHVVEHYQVALTEAAGDSEAQMRADARAALRAAGARRHASQSRDSSGLLRAHLQARARADLAARLHVRIAQLPGRRQRLHRPHRRPVSVQPVEDRLPDPARDRRRPVHDR